MVLLHFERKSSSQIVVCLPFRLCISRACCVSNDTAVFTWQPTSLSTPPPRPLQPPPILGPAQPWPLSTLLVWVTDHPRREGAAGRLRHLYHHAAGGDLFQRLRLRHQGMYIMWRHFFPSLFLSRSSVASVTAAG